ncbi:MAG TPA: hypothetical protein DCS93_16755 [Microscillaceae bacterium]|nr:hypothetical protein [Microscillaceae bacterium]
MLRNYIKIAFRNLFSNKTHSTVNILGLALGIATCVLIVAWIQDELSYDQFHTKKERLFMVMGNETQDNTITEVSGTPAPLSPALKNEIPEVAQAIRLYNTKHLLDYEGKKSYENGIYAGKQFFDMFSFPFTKGNPKTALSGVNVVVITQSLAYKYFGNQNPLGKTFKISESFSAKVTGVIKDIPTQSHLQFNFVLSAACLQKDVHPRLFTAWNRGNWLNTYVLLHKKENARLAKAKVANIIKKHYPESKVSLFLRPVNQLYLHSQVDGKTQRIQQVYMLGLVALFIFLIACVNFVNLSTSLSLRRAKEVGLRKVVGATRSQLIQQFLGEALFITLIASIIGITIVELFLPEFNHMVGKTLSIHFFGIRFILYLLGGVLFTGLLAGSYPAFVLADFAPTKVLKGKFSKSKKGRKLKRGLMIVQFSLSTALVMTTLIIYHQFNYISNKNLGFKSDNIISFGLGYAQQAEDPNYYPRLKNDLLKLPGVKSVSGARHHITNYLSDYWMNLPDGRKIPMNTAWVGYDYLQTFGIQLKEGRSFSKEFAQDKQCILLNEKAVSMMGLKNPVNTTVDLNGKKVKVIGVVKDYHFKSLYNKITPLSFALISNFNQSYAKLKGENIAQELASVRKVWQKHNPVYPFEYRFLDADFEQLYLSEQSLLKAMNYFAFLGILIACLGLFGLAAHALQENQKEIGIHKVLGASIQQIIRWIFKSYAIWITIASVIGMALAYYVMQAWLQDFAYHIKIDWRHIALTALISIVTTLLTISPFIWQTTRVNPAQVLKDE